MPTVLHRPPAPRFAPMPLLTSCHTFLLVMLLYSIPTCNVPGIPSFGQAWSNLSESPSQPTFFAKVLERDHASHGTVPRLTTLTKPTMFSCSWRHPNPSGLSSIVFVPPEICIYISHSFPSICIDSSVQYEAGSSSRGLSLSGSCE